MNKVEFDEESSSFILSVDGISIPYPYIPSRKGIWEDMEDEDFEVVLLNNPFLHKETDYFELKFDGSEERGGFLFPVFLLESEEITDRIMLSYMFVSFRTLLCRLEGDATGVLSDSFRDAFILVVHKKTKADFCIDDYMFSLAGNGFYLYKGTNTSRNLDLAFFKSMTRSLRLDRTMVNNLNNGYVKDLVTDQLIQVSDFLTRFILIYQVVELFISGIHHRLLDEKIDAYKKKQLNRNDFSEDLKSISREGYQIECLVKEYHEEKVCKEYSDEVRGLFNDIGYVPNSYTVASLLYALRNQIFHNYGRFLGHEEQLFDAIFRFERVIMFLLMNKPLNYV